MDMMQRTPSLAEHLAEGRAIFELITFILESEALAAGCPHGDGRPVLVIPGFLTSDLVTLPLRRFLRQLDYYAYGWKQGINFGPRPGTGLRLMRRIAYLHRKHGRKVVLIGWSLGGIYAREAARYNPKHVDRVITLGSPHQGDPKLSPLWRIFSYLNRRYLRANSQFGFALRSRPLSVPTMSIFTRGDGIVCWRSCAIPRGHPGVNVEVRGSHCGLPHNPNVLRQIALDLAA